MVTRRPPRPSGPSSERKDLQEAYLSSVESEKFEYTHLMKDLYDGKAVVPMCKKKLPHPVSFLITTTSLPSHEDGRGFVDGIDFILSKETREKMCSLGLCREYLEDVEKKGAGYYHCSKLIFVRREDTFCSWFPSLPPLDYTEIGAMEYILETYLNMCFGVVRDLRISSPLLTEVKIVWSCDECKDRICVALRGPDVMIPYLSMGIGAMKCGDHQSLSFEGIYIRLKEVKKHPATSPKDFIRYPVCVHIEFFGLRDGCWQCGQPECGCDDEEDVCESSSV